MAVLVHTFVPLAPSAAQWPTGLARWAVCAFDVESIAPPAFSRLRTPDAARLQGMAPIARISVRAHLVTSRLLR